MRLEPLEERTLLSFTAAALDDGTPLQYMSMNSASTAPEDTSQSVIDIMPQSAVTLGNVPTSRWTVGCSATSAGMMFGYYDRTGYSNIRTLDMD
jgi:hypothetical protein